MGAAEQDSAVTSTGCCFCAGLPRALNGARASSTDRPGCAAEKPAILVPEETTPPVCNRGADSRRSATLRLVATQAPLGRARQGGRGRGQPAPCRNSSQN